MAHLTGPSTVTVNSVHLNGQTGQVERLLDSQGSLWAAGTMLDPFGGSPTRGFVARLDITTGKVLGVASVNGQALSLAATTKGIWATNGQGYLYQVVPKGTHGLIVRPTRMLHYPSFVQSLTGAGRVSLVGPEFRANHHPTGPGHRRRASRRAVAQSHRRSRFGSFDDSRLRQGAVMPLRIQSPPQAVCELRRQRPTPWVHRPCRSP